MAPLKVDEMKKPDTLTEQGGEPAVEKKPSSRAGKFRISIYDAWCKQCGLCVDFCPKKVLSDRTLESPEVSAPDQCIGCQLCVMHCPDFAISVTQKEETEEKPEV
jgi:2-oxoglutarate ferredoxin oxidoreductase subunit delta